MRKPKITIDRPKISEAELAANKDFGALMARFHAAPPVSIPKPFYKTGWFISANAVVVAGVALLIFQLLKKPENIVNPVMERPKEVAISNDTTAIKTEDTLSALVIDSQSVSFDYDSLLMAPIVEAVMEPEPVVGKQQLKSPKVIKGKTNVPAIANDTKQWLLAEIEKIKLVIEEVKKSEPAKPAQQRGYRFKLDIVPEEFPKLTKHNGLLWEIGSEKQNEKFTPDLLEREWDEGKIKVYNRDVNYKLLLRKGEEKYTFIIYPVLKDNEYDKYVRERAAHQKKLDSLSSLKSSLEQKYNKL